MTEEEQAHDALSAQGVRDFLDGKIDGQPEPGTLAHRVWLFCCACWLSGEVS